MLNIGGRLSQIRPISATFVAVSIGSIVSGRRKTAVAGVLASFLFEKNR